jgi:hypothetical protein
MRKILIGFLIVLLVIMAYLMIFKGLELGDFKVLSASQIVEENDRLTKEISDTEVLMNSEYPTKTEELDTSVSKLLTAKDEYLELASVSTKSELSKASTVETYTVEFLWTRLGRHATAEGVNLNYTPSGNSIDFTVVGEYIPILSFIATIENDSKLGFTIENFKLVPSGENLQASFTTRNVNIKKESTTNTSSSSDTPLVTQENTDTSTQTQTETETETQPIAQ